MSAALEIIADMEPESVLEMWQQKLITDDDYHAYLLDQERQREEEQKRQIEEPPVVLSLTEELESREAALAEITDKLCRHAALMDKLRQEQERLAVRYSMVQQDVKELRRCRRAPGIAFGDGWMIYAIKYAHEEAEAA